jgi:hypothetical protein
MATKVDGDNTLSTRTKLFYVSEQKLPWYKKDTENGDAIVQIEFRSVRDKHGHIEFALFTDPNRVIVSLAAHVSNLKQALENIRKWVVVGRYHSSSRLTFETSENFPPTVKKILDILEAARVMPAEMATSSRSLSKELSSFSFASAAAAASSSPSSPSESFSALTELTRICPKLTEKLNVIRGIDAQILILNYQVHGEERALQAMNECIEVSHSDLKKLKRKLADQNEEKRKKALVDASNSTVSGDCLVCFETKPHLLTTVPCGHTFVCDDCVKLFKEKFKLCAICSLPYSDIIKVYMPPPSSAIATANGVKEK